MAAEWHRETYALDAQGLPADLGREVSMVLRADEEWLYDAVNTDERVDVIKESLSDGSISYDEAKGQLCLIVLDVIGVLIVNDEKSV